MPRVTKHPACCRYIRRGTVASCRCLGQRPSLHPSLRPALRLRNRREAVAKKTTSSPQNPGYQEIYGLSSVAVPCLLPGKIAPLRHALCNSGARQGRDQGFALDGSDWPGPSPQRHPKKPAPILPRRKARAYWLLIARPTPLTSGLFILPLCWPSFFFFLYSLLPFIRRSLDHCVQRPRGLLYIFVSRDRL